MPSIHLKVPNLKCPLKTQMGAKITQTFLKSPNLNSETLSET